MQNNKTVLLLINIGSPSELSVKAVKAYLRKFLMDPYVIQIPFILRYILFYLVICNIRAPKTFLKYKSIWLKEGSPFHFFTEKFRHTLEKRIGIRVMNIMMYSDPDFDSAFAFLNQENFSKIIVAPMYPQYAASSYVSSAEKFKYFLNKSQLKAEVKFVDPFYRNDFFINSFYSNIITQYPDFKKYDHIVFSYHGLPQSHVKKIAPEFDYQKQCFATTELLARKLQLNENNYVTCFQSRVGLAKWIEPYLDQTCESLARGGKKNILIISPSFVVDGLETLQEISDLEKSLQLSYQIKLDLVKGLNSEDIWVQNFSEFIIQQHLN